MPTSWSTLNNLFQLFWHWPTHRDIASGQKKWVITLGQIRPWLSVFSALWIYSLGDQRGCAPCLLHTYKYNSTGQSTPTAFTAPRHHCTWTTKEKKKKCARDSGEALVWRISHFLQVAHYLDVDQFLCFFLFFLYLLISFCLWGGGAVAGTVK